MSDSAQSAYWLSSDDDDNTNNKSTIKQSTSLTDPPPLQSINENENETNNTKMNKKISGKKRSQNEINLTPSTVKKKKRRLNRSFIQFKEN
eukprot:147275_1